MIGQLASRFQVNSDMVDALLDNRLNLQS